METHLAILLRCLLNWNQTIACFLTLLVLEHGEMHIHSKDWDIAQEALLCKYKRLGPILSLVPQGNEYRNCTLAVTCCALVGSIKPYGACSQNICLFYQILMTESKR